jgi:hypothetical protein
MFVIVLLVLFQGHPIMETTLWKGYPTTEACMEAAKRQLNETDVAEGVRPLYYCQQGV